MEGLHGVAASVTEWVEWVRRSRYRGLLVLLGEPGWTRGVLSELLGGRVLHVYWPARGGGLGAGLGWDRVRADRVHELLGSEYDHVVVEAYGGLRASVLAAAGEMVAGGGVLAVVDRGSWEEWRPGLVRGSPFGAYLRHSIVEHCRQVMVYEEARGPVLERRAGPAPPPRTPPRGVLGRLPGWLRGLVATRGQAEALHAARRLMGRLGASSLLVLGNRGRGKSAALGLALALLAWEKRIGDVAVVSPSEPGLRQVHRFLARGLGAARVPHRSRGGGGPGTIVVGPWFRVEFVAAGEQPPPSPLLVVDEAAALGPARLRRLASRARKIVAATTVHGYEGSGRMLAARVAELLPSPETVWLEEPIRYPAGDPLEEWLYKALVLDPEPGEPPATERGLAYRVYNGGRLAGEPSLLRAVQSLLAQAHYRNTPDDLQLLLEAGHTVHVLTAPGGRVAAVAQVSPAPDKLLGDVAERVYGVRVEAARVVRIAVHPALQRRGLGSRLLARVEEAVGEDLVGASFSNWEALGFWLRNGYAVVYVSPRFNRLTGEKNIVVLKSLGQAHAKLVEDMAADARRRLAALASSIYRDLRWEDIAVILTSCKPRACTRPRLTGWEAHRLERVLSGDYPELAQEAIASLAVAAAEACRLRGLGPGELGALVVGVLQGKPSWEAASLLGLGGRGEYEGLLRRAAEKLLVACSASEAQPGP